MSSRRHSDEEWLDDFERQEDERTAQSAADQLRHIARNANSDSVRVQALKALMDRGLDVHDNDDDPFGLAELSDEALDGLLRGFMDPGYTELVDVAFQVDKRVHELVDTEAIERRIEVEAEKRAQVLYRQQAFSVVHEKEARRRGHGRRKDAQESDPEPVPERSDEGPQAAAQRPAWSAHVPGAMDPRVTALAWPSRRP